MREEAGPARQAPGTTGSGIPALVALILLSACRAGPTGSDDASRAPADAVVDSAPDGAATDEADAGTRDEARPDPGDDGTVAADDWGDGADLPGEPSPDAPGVDTGDLGAGDEAPDDSRDPGPACDPEVAPCPCAIADDCPDRTWCDGSTCKPWECIPDSRFCGDSILVECRPDGGGFRVLEDCDDHDPCTLGDGCAGTHCLPRTARACPDDNPCTAGSCDRATGECVFVPIDGAPCDDGDPCTTADRCESGACVPGGAAPCSDGNPCTSDYCTSLLGCVHEPVAATCGLPGDPCQAGRECRQGACVDVPITCDDGDPCTLDGCDEGSCWTEWIPGCFCRDATDCDDGDDCTLDSCTGGRCDHGTAALPGCCGADPDCDDGDPCTLDRCDGSRCRVDPAPDPACCDPVPLRADFEGSSAVPFELDPAGADGIGWHVMPAPVGTGNALVFGDATGSGYDNGDRVSGTATSPRVLLPAGVALELAFRTWQDVEDVPGQDPFQVEAVTREGSTSVAWSRPAGFPMRTWQTVSVDLSAMAGRTIRLRFRFDTVDGTENTGRGVIVDDVAIAGPCQPRGCQRGSDCTSLGWHAACRAGACDYQDALSTRSAPGDPGTGISFAGPSDVALTPDGSRVYVSDRDAHRVLVLDAAGRPTGEVIGSAGTAPGLLQLPRGLAADADHLYVADSGNHRIQAFTPAGVFLWALGSKGDAPGRFNEPKGLGLSRDGDVLWVADTSNHRVQGFSPWGVVRVVIGSYGREDGQFRSPSCAVPLPDGGVLVCDTQNNRLQVFRASGAHVATFAPDDGVPLTQPYGAAVAGEGRFWVSDTYNHRLVLLDAGGRVDDRYGRAGGGVGGFSYPLGMESDPSGGLWVVDSGNRRVVALVRGPVP